MIDQPDGTGERAAAEKPSETAQRRLDGHAGMGVGRIRASEPYCDRLVVGFFIEEPRPQLVAGKLGQRQRLSPLRDVEARTHVFLGVNHSYRPNLGRELCQPLFR
jgi:hypothetical protein